MLPNELRAKTLGVARSNLAERKKGATKPRGRFRKAANAELTPLTRAIVDERPTYGYRRNLRADEPALELPLVFGSSRNRSPQRRGRVRAVRHRPLRPRDHRLVGRGQWRRLGRVRDQMIAAVERRFDALKVPHQVERLSDNGSAYIAADTADTARALGLTLLFTPVRRPESNGMSASFVKTLKRDYARLGLAGRENVPCQVARLDRGLL